MAANDQELADRLAKVADMLNDPGVGPASPELDKYIQEHADDDEFVQLASLARRLKRNVRSKVREEVQ